MRAMHRAGRHVGRKLFVAAALAAAIAAPRGAPAQFDENGWITQWLYFGPLSQTSGDSPGIEGIRADYLADGVSNYEATILPEEGYETIPDFGGAARSIGWHPILPSTPVDWTAIDTTQVPGNTNLNSVDPLWIHSDGMTRVAIDDAVFYGVFYVNNPGATAIDCFLHTGTDDSCQVKIDDCEVLLVNLGRGWGDPTTAQDVTPVRLEPGPHRVLVKVFNGGGDTGWRLRFADGEGSPITDITDPAIEASLDPADFNLTKIEPFGVSAARSIDPEKVIGTETRPLVAITVQRTYAALPDSTIVEVTETLPDHVTVTNPVPEYTSKDGNSFTWRIALGDIPLEGIQYEAQLLQAKNVTFAGTIRVGSGAACGAVAIGGETEVYAVKRNAIFLGDIVGGGTGRGDKDPDIWAIDTDLGVFRTSAELLGILNHNTVDTNGVNPEPVPDSDLVDSVFFFTTTAGVPITSLGAAGPKYDFRAGDENANAWDWILSNLTNDVDKGPGNVICGNVKYTTGVGIHASSGVTFDLEAIRAEHGEDAVVYLSVVCGTDQCGAGVANNNTVNLYIIYSDEASVIVDYVYEFTGANQSQFHSEPIPPEAKFLTFATGSRGDGIGCDHGVFAEARIFPELPEAKVAADPVVGGPPLTVAFSAAGSTAPLGRTIVDYEWDFGDGSPAAKGETTTHVYAARGRYTATVTVTDSAGYDDTETVEIQALFNRGDVSPWVSRDIGKPYTVGGARLEGPCAVVFGGGTGFAGTADQHHLLYQPVAGDFTVTARLDQAAWEPAATGSSRAGLMARSSAAAGSPYVFLGLLPGLSPRAVINVRTAEDARATTRSVAGFVPSLPNCWFRIQRAGSGFTCYASSDGAAWTEIRTETIPDAPAEMLVGLAVAGGDTGTTGNAGTVTFCDLAGFPSIPAVEVCDDGADNDGDGKIDCEDPDCAQAPNCQVGTLFRRGDANADGGINITDGIFILNYLFLGGPEPPCMEAADPNDDGSNNITDGVYILNFLFLGGPPPTAPGHETCGPDPEGSPDLGCASYEAC